MSVTLQAQWNEKGSYTVHYDTNGGTPSSIASRTGVKWTGAGLLPSPENPARTGWTFAGWKVRAGGKNADGTGKTGFLATDLYADLAKNDTTGAITLQAQWTVNSGYTVNYDVNGGAPAEIAARTGVKWTDAGLLPAGNPTRTGWIFAGWNVSAGGNAVGVTNAAAYGSLASGDRTMSITLQAQWTQVGYTVRYLPGAHGAIVAVTLSGLHYGDAMPAAPAAPGTAGWRFTGWSPARGLAVTDSVDYTAQWALNTYSIYYHGNGHTSGSEPSVTTLSHGATYTVSAAGSLARSGYSFEGWAPSASAAAAVAAYNPGAANTLTSEVHLYAVWKEDKAPVTPVVTPVTPVEPGDDDDITSAPAPENSDLAAEGFNQQDIDRIESQSGNPFSDLIGGKVPLGNGKTAAVWSLLSMLLSIIAVVITVLLAVGTLLRRKEGRDNEALGMYRSEERARTRGNLLKIPACAAGVLTLIIWLILDDLSLPLAWVNKWTGIIVVIFIIHLVLLAAYKLLAGRRPEDEDDEVNTKSGIA
jgi:uncharacterized repeat protein (TIGR02543 family)